MVEYFLEKHYLDAKKQRKTTLNIYFMIMGLYLIASVALYWWYRTLPYLHSNITTVKIIHYSLTAIAVIFSFIYLGIPYKRVNRYYKLTYNLMTGIRETSTGSFFEYDETLQDKDGVDFKSLVFIEWNKYKNDFFERKVLVFDEMPFPELKENQNVKYITQGNVLISYEILS
ncbi:MAG: hypothetical protein IJV95_02675 [Clostridia bacterium]|nr:hypothetical protein [Clostridia bacterium]